MRLFLCFSDSEFLTDKWLCLHLPSLSGCDVILCHFQSSFVVLALLCSHFPSPSETWFLTSLHDGQWYNVGFSVPSSLLQPRHFFTSDHPTSYTLVGKHPPSTTSFPRHIAVLVCPRFVGLSSQHSYASTILWGLSCTSCDDKCTPPAHVWPWHTVQGQAFHLWCHPNATLATS